MNILGNWIWFWFTLNCHMIIPYMMIIKLVNKKCETNIFDHLYLHFKYGNHLSILICYQTNEEFRALALNVNIPYCIRCFELGIDRYVLLLYIRIAWYVYMECHYIIRSMRNLWYYIIYFQFLILFVFWFPFEYNIVRC